jgi:N-acetylglucosamine kinase
MTHVLGIDAGGTKTVCLLADEEGRVVAEARGGGANLQTAGELGVEKVLHTVMEEAIGDRQVVPAAICLGIAGVDRAEDGRIIRAIMRRIGFKARTLIVNDALVALCAGVDRDPGIVIIAGTGSIAYGRNACNRAARSGGWGYVLGDEGSGYWIGREALRAVVRQADGRGPETALTTRVLAHFGVSSPSDLVHVVYYPDLKPQAIAALGAVVEQARRDGDPIARDILDAAARELAAAADSVTRRLDMSREAFSFILAGGMFRAIPSLTAQLTGLIGLIAPRSSVLALDAEPAVGAVRLALAHLRGDATLPEYL